MNEASERTAQTAEPTAFAAELRQPETDLPGPVVNRPGSGPNEHQTEAEGWQAIWKFDHTSIRILQVHSISDDVELVRADNHTAAADLTQLREQFPHLSPLWDAIRHQFWAESLCPGSHSLPSLDV